VGTSIGRVVQGCADDGAFAAPGDVLFDIGRTAGPKAGGGEAGAGEAGASYLEDVEKVSTRRNGTERTERNALDMPGGPRVVVQRR